MSLPSALPHKSSLDEAGSEKSLTKKKKKSFVLQFSTFNVTHKGPLVSREEEVQAQVYSSRPSAAMLRHTFQHGRQEGLLVSGLGKDLHCDAGGSRKKTEQLETAARARETELLFPHNLIHRPLAASLLGPSSHCRVCRSSH